MINSNDELREYLKLTNHVIRQQCEAVETGPVTGPFGIKIKNRAKQFVSRGFEPVYGQFRESSSGERTTRGAAIASRRRIQEHRESRGRKMVFTMPGLKK